MVAALDDDEHEAVQRERYANRRQVLMAAFASAGFTIEHSQTGLYLWATRGEPCRDTVDWLAQRGVLVARRLLRRRRCAACANRAHRDRRGACGGRATFKSGPLRRY